MNLNLDFSAVPRALRGMLAELRQKKLWPLAILLLAGVVAVPVLLSKSSSPAPATAALPATPPPAAGTTLPALDVQTTRSRSRITGSARNPFSAAAGSSAPTSTTPASSAATAASVATSVATSLGGSGSGGASSSPTSNSSSTPGSSTATPTTSPTTSSSSSSGGNPPSIVPNAKPKPAPAGLTKTESYDVSLAMTNASGGLNTVDPLERLSVLPNETQPQLVELGVLQGGSRVLFVVQPGASVKGPGTCIPGPLDCVILSLGQDQTESVAARGSSSSTLFAVTSVSATDHGSVAGADRARRVSSPAGRALLNASASSALSLFQYEPSLGYVVDMRNLTVGGS